MFTPADIPQVYKNTVEDLLLEILNVMPVLNGDPNTVLNGEGNWIIPGSGSGLPAPGTDGDVITGQNGSWQVFQRAGLLTYNIDNNSAHVNLTAENDSIVFSGNREIKGQAGYIQFTGETAYDKTQYYYSNNAVRITNKAKTGTLPFVTILNSPYADNVISLSNINSLNCANSDLNLGGYNQWVCWIGLDGSGRILAPSGDGISKLGNSSTRWKSGSFMDYCHSTGGFTSDNGTTKFKINDIVSTSVTLDPTRHIPITINGITYKLLVST